MVPQAMIWVMESTDTARQGPASMSRKLGIQATFRTCECGQSVSIDDGETLGRHLGLGEGRHLCRKAVKPGDELGMRRPPVAAEAKIAVAEKTGERDLADIRDRVERRRIALQYRQSTHDLAGLVIGPFPHVML